MIKIAFLNLLRRKSRTFLALLGIMIGVAAIIALVSVVDGIQGEVKNIFSQMQGVSVTQKGSFGPISSGLDESLGNEFEAMPGVRVAVPQIINTALSVDDQKIAMGLSGVRMIGFDFDKYLLARNAPYMTNMVEGQMLTSKDEGYVAIGKSVKDAYNKVVGSTIKVNGKKFKIKGVFSSSSTLIDQTIAFNLKDLRDLLVFPEGRVTAFLLDLDNPDDDQKIIQQIKFKYPNLNARTASDSSAMIGDLFENLRLLVFAVAGLAAVVAGVGIMNTLLMSVLERFKEIGALRAVGWTASNVMFMVLLESIFIGVLGGLLGIGLGFIASYGLQLAGLTAKVTLELVLQAFVFALVLGLVGGIYPAYRASKMDPIQALREE